MHDLYADDTDLFIAGFAMGNCRVAAFSLYRYDPYLTFNEADWFDCGLSKSTESTIEIDNRQNLLLLRACRLLTHEICHLLGIAHCIYYSCLINGSGDLGRCFSLTWLSGENRSLFSSTDLLCVRRVKFSGLR